MAKKKKKDMTPAQKAAARRNPDAPKVDKNRKPNKLNDSSPLGGMGFMFLVMIAILLAVFAFLYLNNFFGMLG